MTEPRDTLWTEARTEVRRIIEALESIRWRLLGVQLSLPEPIEETVRLQEVADEMDPAAELRTVIHCVLNDSLRPAIEDLRDAADLPSKESHETDPAAFADLRQRRAAVEMPWRKRVIFPSG